MLSTAVSWRYSMKGLSRIIESIASLALNPCDIRSSSSGPRFGSVTFCVATAPTPARAWGQRAPTAMDEVVMATPKAPDLAQRPAMEKVIASIRNNGGHFDFHDPFGPRQRRDDQAG